MDGTNGEVAGTGANPPPPRPAGVEEANDR
jgi:hypothetical protein